MGKSPPRSPPPSQAKGQPRKSNSPPTVGPGVSNIRQVPTNPARRVPTTPQQPSRLAAPNQPSRIASPNPPSRVAAQQPKKKPKISAYTAKRVPDKTSSYGKKKNPEVIPDGQKNVLLQPPEPSDQPKQPEDLLKKQFARAGFEIIGHLGSGTYAEVWKVVKLDTGKIWAAKVISVDKDKTTENYQFKFLPRELDILPRIIHKNIIKVYTILQFTQFNGFGVVMEWAPGGTLSDVIRRDGPLMESRARMLMSPIFDAIAYLHRNNYAHRDIKLENVLLDKRGRPKITDFSYVIDVSKTNSTNEHPKGGTGLSATFCGTEPYLAPEIMLHIPYNPFLADIWALGVTLFVLTNNTLPFKIGDDIPTEVVTKEQFNRNWRFRERLKLSNQFRDLIAQCLEPEPSKRINIIGVINHPWTKI